MYAVSVQDNSVGSQPSQGRPSFFPVLYASVIAGVLLVGGMTGVMLGDSTTGENPPEAVAFVDAGE